MAPYMATVIPQETPFGLPQKKYDVILADPPWPYYGSPDKWGAAGKYYSLMGSDMIWNMRVRDLLYPHSVVFLWATGPQLALAVETLNYWGCYYRGLGFVWIKTKKDGTPIKAQGVRPSIIKPLTELVLCGSPTYQGRPMPIASEAVQQTVFAVRREHSRKPDEVYERIEALYPEASKIELFCRGKPRVGWTGWGDECET